MYSEEDIDFLNEEGVITSSVLMRRHKCSAETARQMLKLIVDVHENVKFRTEDQIYIEGIVREEWMPKEKKKRIAPKKPPKWKDLTKP